MSGEQTHGPSPDSLKVAAWDWIQKVGQAATIPLVVLIVMMWADQRHLMSDWLPHVEEFKRLSGEVSAKAARDWVESRYVSRNEYLQMASDIRDIKNQLRDMKGK